jgi:quercetin dioxygenase-like cupin family protein
MENTNNSITTVASQGGPSLSVVGDTYRIIMGGEQTNGAYALIDMLIPPRGGPGPHSHATFQEAFYILDGEIKVITKEKTYAITKGSYVNIIYKYINLTTEQIKRHTFSALQRLLVWRKCSKK